MISTNSRILKSSCCGADVIAHPQEYVCAECGLSCIPVAKEEEDA